MIALVFAQVRIVERLRDQNHTIKNNKLLFNEKKYISMTSLSETMANIWNIFRFSDWTRLGLLHYGKFSVSFSHLREK